MEQKGEINVQYTQTDIFHTFIYAGDLKLLYFLMILMCVDIITGLAKGFKIKIYGVENQCMDSVVKYLFSVLLF